jgi:23S rRNA (adenine2503-C2)-methyltransferase
VDAGERYARATGYPIQYQWTLLEGINDTDEELAGIVRCSEGQVRRAEHDPVQQRARRLTSSGRRGSGRRDRPHLHRRGILTKLRKSAGQDVEGGCGQLRARAITPPGLQLTM